MVATTEIEPKMTTAEMGAMIRLDRLVTEIICASTGEEYQQAEFMKANARRKRTKADDPKYDEISAEVHRRITLRNDFRTNRLKAQGQLQDLYLAALRSKGTH